MNEKLRALYKGALQGATMGLADEAIGGVGALYARAMSPELFQGDSFFNTYSKARDLDRVENKQLEQNNPWAYGGANLVSGVAMPLGMAGQGLKGAVKAGGIAGGLTGYGISEKTNPYALALDTATGAGLGAGAGAALYGAGKVATNPQVQKFAKDYLADESGALNIGDNQTDKFIDYLNKKAKEFGVNISDIQKSKNRNGDYSSYIDLGKGRAKASLRLSDHISNEKYNTNSANIIIGDDAQTYKDIDNLLLQIKNDADLYEKKYIQNGVNKALDNNKMNSYTQQRDAILNKIKLAKEKGYGGTFDKIPEYEKQIEKLNALIGKK